MLTKLMRRATLATFVLGMLAWPGTLFAQGENPITWTLAEGPKQVKPAQKKVPKEELFSKAEAATEA